MGTVNEIVEAYRKLSPDEQSKVLFVLNHLDDDDWDRQIQADAESGKLDKVFADDIAAFKAGTCREI